MLFSLLYITFRRFLSNRLRLMFCVLSSDIVVYLVNPVLLRPGFLDGDLFSGLVFHPVQSYFEFQVFNLYSTRNIRLRVGCTNIIIYKLVYIHLDMKPIYYIVVNLVQPNQQHRLHPPPPTPTNSSYPATEYYMD